MTPEELTQITADNLSGYALDTDEWLDAYLAEALKDHNWEPTAEDVSDDKPF